MGSGGALRYISPMIKRPWLDYSGQFSALKATVFVALFLPGIWVAANLALGHLGSRPLTEAIHQIGLWMIRFLFLALAVTPLRRLLQWPRLLLVRRMVGVAAWAYGVTHLTLYAADEAFNLAMVVSEIATRIYLTIGFTALLGLTTLAATSTDGMVRRLGAQRWQRLHRIVYGIGVLACIHFFLQSKLDEWEPTMMAGLFVWLMGWRLLARGRPSPWRLVSLTGALSLVAGAATALGEAGYFWLAMGVDPLRILAVDFTLQTGIRPAWAVLVAGLSVTLAAALRTGLSHYGKLRLRPA